jgi:choline monooxygenase
MTDAPLESALGAADLAALARPTEQAHGLPGRAYGPEFFELERRKLFPRAWCAVGFGAQVPNPGDMAPLDLAGWPLLMVRDRAGGIRVYLNACRHRGMRLVSEPCSGRTTIRCPWHAWTYDLDGRLVATPNLGGENVAACAGFDRAELGLKELAVGRWLDYVFVDIDGKAPPFDAYIAPLERLLRGWNLDGLGHGGGWQGSYPGNWKGAIEGAIEDYHLPWGHPEIMKGVVSRHPRTHVEGAMACVSSRIERAGAAPQAGPRDRGLPAIAYDGDGERERVYIVNMFPTAVLSIALDHVMLSLFTPNGPAETRLDFRCYYPGSVATDPAFAARRQAVIDGWAFVALQDVPFVAGVQATHWARDALGLPVRLTPAWEGAVHHFQKNVVATLGVAG